MRIPGGRPGGGWSGSELTDTLNWPLLILTDSPEFPRKLTIAGMVDMCENEAKVTNKGLIEIGETCTQRTCSI